MANTSVVPGTITARKSFHINSILMAIVSILFCGWYVTDQKGEMTFVWKRVNIYSWHVFVVYLCIYMKKMLYTRWESSGGTKNTMCHYVVVTASTSHNDCCANTKNGIAIAQQSRSIFWEECDPAGTDDNDGSYLYQFYHKDNHTKADQRGLNHELALFYGCIMCIQWSRILYRCVV